MKYLIFILLFLFIHTLLRGQEDWGKDIKKAFREENYEEVIRLCNEDAQSYSKSCDESTDHDYMRNRILKDARECRKLIDGAQKANDSNKAKEIIKIREEIWPIVGEGEPISHPFTDSLIVKIERRAQIRVKTTRENNKKEVEQYKLEKDSILLVLKSIEKKLDEKSVILSGEMLEKDSTYQVLLREREKLRKEYDVLEEALDFQNKQIAELETVIQLQKKGNFLPLGIKQFRNGKKALGYTFLLSEIAVPVALGVGLERAANQKYNEYKHQKAQTLSDHKECYKKYRNYHRAAIWAPVAAEVLVYGANVLCNYYCPIKRPNIALHPALEVDWRGKVLCGVGMSFNF